MRLDLPSPVPLPPDVRRRALDTVLAGIDGPVPRRPGWAPALLAAAVAVALVVGVSVGVGRGTDPASSVAASPAPSTPDVTRCADAVEAAGRAQDYPPREQWRPTTGGYENIPDRIVVINDSFACLVTPVSVSVSPGRGTAMGDASLVRLGPAVLAVLNPQRRVVRAGEVSGVRSPNAEGVIPLLLDGIEVPAGEVVVEGSYVGPLPEPAPPLTVDDRVLPTRGYATDDEIDLDACVTRAAPWRNSHPELWLPVGRRTGPPSVLLTRISDQFAGFCVLADVPRLVDGRLPPPGDPRPQVVATEPADAEDVAVSSVLLTVPATTRRVEMDTDPPAAGGDDAGAPCTVADGLAFCAGEGPLEDNTVYLYDDPAGAPTHEVRPRQ